MLAVFLTAAALATTAAAIGDEAGASTHETSSLASKAQAMDPTCCQCIFGSPGGDACEVYCVSKGSACMSCVGDAGGKSCGAKCGCGWSV